MTSPAPPTIPPSAFAARRRAVFERLGDGVMVLPGAPVQLSSRDTERPYVPDRELYYLTGLVEPGTVAVLVGGATPRFEVFARERDPDAELWAGVRLGPDVAGSVSGADEAHPLSELGTRLPELLAAADRIYVRLGRGGEVERLVGGALDRARARGPRTGTGPRGVVDPGELLDDLRLIKDEHELAVIREACRITVEGHRAAAATIRPGVGEWAIEAAVEAAFRAARATGPGFETIVGSGPNACVLHYVRNEDVAPEGALVLVDAGAELGLYHGDVTRTFPASGDFTAPQREVYDIVERARATAIETARPGETIAAVHEAAVRVLAEGLVALGVLRGAADDVVGDGSHKPYYPHQTSHWLGLDVHDPGDYARDAEPRVLRPGMVFTVEPGLYFRPELELPGDAARYAGIGIRIEDDVLISETGAEVLTAELPTSATEVERLVGA